VFNSGCTKCSWAAKTKLEAPATIWTHPQDATYQPLPYFLSDS